MKGSGSPVSRASELRSYIPELSKAEGVSRAHLLDLIQVARGKDLDMIVGYLRSAAAANIKVWDRAVLIHRCVQKAEIFSIMKDLFL